MLLVTNTHMGEMRKKKNNLDRLGEISMYVFGRVRTLSYTAIYAFVNTNYLFFSYSSIFFHFRIT